MVMIYEMQKNELACPHKTFSERHAANIYLLKNFPEEVEKIGITGNQVSFEYTKIQNIFY